MNWEKTSWTNTTDEGIDITATIHDILEFASSPQKMNIQDIASVRISPESEERMMSSDLSYPLLVLQHSDGRYQVLDGNHRLAKALHIQQSEVLVRIVKFEVLPKIWQWLFGEKYIGEIMKKEYKFRDKNTDKVRSLTIDSSKLDDFLADHLHLELEE